MWQLGVRSGHCVFWRSGICGLEGSGNRLRKNCCAPFLAVDRNAGLLPPLAGRVGHGHSQVFSWNTRDKAHPSQSDTTVTNTHVTNTPYTDTIVTNTRYTDTTVANTLYTDITVTNMHFTNTPYTD